MRGTAFTYAAAAVAVAVVLAACAPAPAAGRAVTDQSVVGRSFNIFNESMPSSATTAIFELTPSNRTWTNPYTGEVVHLFDEINVDILGVGSTECYEEWVLVQTWEEVVQSFDHKLSISASLGYKNVSVGLAFNSDHKHVDELTKNGTAYFAMTNCTVLHYGFAIDTLKQRLSAPAVELLQKLNPEECYGKNDTCRYEYCYVRNKLGSHIITNARFGGHTNFSVSMDTSYYNHWSQDFKDHNIGVTLKYMKQKVGAFNSSTNYNRSSIDGQFYNKTSRMNVVQGGNDTVYRADGFGPWEATLDKLPAFLLFNSHVEPLHALMDPFKFGPTRIEQMRQAIIDDINCGGCACAFPEELSAADLDHVHRRLDAI